MPPRRSCFWEDELRLRPGRGGFNATTAFLLPEDFLVRVEWIIQFQCHHGVPASLLELS